MAAGFSPLALGTETIGSIVTPSTRAGLYALKVTHGVLDTTGLYTMSEFFDCLGPMAKSAADVRTLAEILLQRTFEPADFDTWKGLSVGFLDPKVWKIDKEMCPPHEGTAEQMVGGCPHYNSTMSDFYTGRRIRGGCETPPEQRLRVEIPR